MNTELIKELTERFESVYGIAAQDVYFAPGRVNLIGEHTDYNGGHVFPCALSVGTYGIIAPRQDSMLRLYSLNLPEGGVHEVNLAELKPGRTAEWTQYPEGVFWVLKEKGYDISRGADIMFAGDVPAGSGLSSSASIEVLTAMMIKDAMGIEALTQVDLALIGQEAENRYNGMQCGIMDQFSSAMGKRSHAIFLDTNTLEYQLVPLVLGDCELVIANTNVKHSLVGSAYNDRRRECEEALVALKTVDEISHIGNLCDLNFAEFEKHQDAITDSVCRRRAKHAVSENERSVVAVEALMSNDLEAFGKLMNASHVSLRDDYEVSCPELDFLAEEAWRTEGVIGGRMTGGGFGGCTVNLVRKDAVEEFIAKAGTAYREKFGIEASFYQASPEEGAHRLDEQEY